MLIESNLRDQTMPLLWPFIAIFMIVVSTSSSLGQELGNDDLSFPYQAFVLKDQAAVRSGPGQVHYATDELSQGATVEVYRHDPGGWCAIRPVKGSFSLVPSAAIEVLKNGVGKVIEARTQAWVGTRLGAVERPLWQVKLRENEEVEILGEVSWPHPDGHSTIWFQIAPPAGEFRWMQISDLQLPPAKQPTIAQSASPIPAAQTEANQRTVTASAIEPSIAPTIALPTSRPVAQANVPNLERRLPVAAKNDSMNLGWRRSTRPIPAVRTNESTVSVGRLTTVDSTPSNPTSSPRPERFASLDSASTMRAPINRVASLTNVPTQPYRAASTAPGQSFDQLQELELQLTQELLKEPSQWQVGSIQRSAQQVYQSATNPIQRQRADRIIAKCQNCQRVQTGFQNAYRPGAANATNAGGSLSGIRGPTMVGSGVREREQEVSFGTTYDAYGWLNELVREQGTIDSEYVLQDRNGKITHHITPSPGLNLHRYLKSKVGVIGQRGYNHKLSLDHVVADRIVVLEKSR